MKSIFQYTGNYKFIQKGTEKKKKVRSYYVHKNTKTTNVRSCYVGTKHQKSAECQIEALISKYGISRAVWNVLTPEYRDRVKKSIA